MRDIIFFYNSEHDLLYITIGTTDIIKIAEAIKEKPWVKEVSDIRYAQLNNEELAKKYLTFYIFRKKPKYNAKIEVNKNIEILDLPELELIKVTKEIFKGVDWNRAITSMVGGAALGTFLFPGFGTIIGCGVGSLIGGTLGLTIGLLPLTDIIRHLVDVINKDENLQK